jgi:hypothetical protein
MNLPPENLWPEKNGIFFDIRPNGWSSAMGKAGPRIHPMSASPLKADQTRTSRHVRFVPKADMATATAYV